MIGSELILVVAAITSVVLLILLYYQRRRNTTLAKTVGLYTTFENISLFVKTVVDKNSLFKQLAKEFTAIDDIRIDTAIVTHNNITIAGNEEDTILYRIPIEDATRNQETIIIDYANSERYGRYKPKGIAMSMHVPIRDGYTINLYSSTKHTFSGEIIRGITRIVKSVDHAVSVVNNRLESKMARILLSSTTEEVVLADMNNVILMVNESFTKATGYTDDEVLGRTPKMLQSGLHSKDFYQKMFNVLQTVGSWAGQVVNRNKDGTLTSKYARVSRFEMSSSLYYLAVYTDLTKEQNSHKQINQLLKYDSLTKLPNRYNAQYKVPLMIDECALLKKSLAFLYIDLDKFGIINETFGYDIGDKCLASVADRIAATLVDCTVFRYEGDEFLALYPAENKKEIALLVMGLQDKFADPVEIEGQNHHVSISVGISVYPHDGIDDKTLIKFADLSSYHAKHSVDGYTFYIPSMEQTAQKITSLQREIRSSLVGKKVGILVQPYVDTDYNIVGYEVFANLPGVRASTSEIIRVSEEYGLLYELGKQVISIAVATHIKGLQMSINVAASQLENPSFVRDLDNEISDSFFDPTNFTLEITENSHISYTIHETLHHINDLGVKITVDHFGSGYSNLEYLVDLPISGIKLSKTHREDDRYLQVVRHIIDLCTSIGVDVSISNLKDKTHLRRFDGFKHAQGNCIYPTMTIEELGVLTEQKTSTHTETTVHVRE